MNVYPCSLMRAVDRAVTLCQYLLPFVRAVYVLGAEDNLPAGGHAACRMEDVVIFSSFIEFGTFAGLMRFMTVEDDARLCYGLGGIRIQLADGYDAFQSGTASCIGVYHVDLSVFIPERAGVYDALARFYEHGFCPRAFGVFGFYHERALVGVAPENVEFTVMMADGRRPYTVAMLRTFRCFDRGEGVGNGSADDTPVNEVFGV